MFDRLGLPFCGICAAGSRLKQESEWLMSSVNGIPGQAHEAATPSIPDEQSRLDDAMRRADDLLISSLEKEERQRRNRRRRILITIGGLAMFAVLGLISLFLLQSNGNSGDAGQLVRQGWALWQQQHFDQAAQKFQQATRANPHLTDAWNGLGWSDFGSGQNDDAEIAFKRAIALEPNFPASLNGLGQVYFSRNELDKAEEYLLKAAPSAPAAWWG